MTHSEAVRAARIIRRFWAELGYLIRADVVRHPADTHDAATWGVETNLRNGLPPNAAPDLREKIIAKAMHK